MTELAVKRGRNFIAWEYLFYFGGGTPPWMSGMAQATGDPGTRPRGRSCSNEPKYLDTARRALGAFETAPPTGVRTTGFARRRRTTSSTRSRRGSTSSTRSSSR